MFLLFFSRDAAVWSRFSMPGHDHLWVWRLQNWSPRADLQKSSGTWHLKEMLGAIHDTRSGGQKGWKIYGQQCWFSPSLFWKMLSFYGDLKGERGQAWERIMAKHVLAANLLGREHEGSRSSVNILIKITLYVQR